MKEEAFIEKTKNFIEAANDLRSMLEPCLPDRPLEIPVHNGQTLILVTLADDIKIEFYNKI